MSAPMGMWPFQILRANQRATVFHLGCVTNVAGPGLVWIFPVIDSLVVVDLDVALPGWRLLSERELKLVVCHITEKYLPRDHVNLDLNQMRQDTRNAPRVSKQMRTFPYE